MKDYFSLLHQPRRPWLDPVALKQSYLTAATTCHPDRNYNATDEARQSANETYAALNEANLCLTEPHTRLRHLFELESGRRFNDLQEIPPDLMDLFSAVHRSFHAVDSFLAERSQATSPMLQVALIERAGNLSSELEHLKATLQGRLQDLEAALRTLDAEWSKARLASAPGNRDELLTRIESLCRLFSFHTRWMSQIQGRLLQMLP